MRDGELRVFDFGLDESKGSLNVGPEHALGLEECQLLFRRCVPYAGVSQELVCLLDQGTFGGLRRMKRSHARG